MDKNKNAAGGNISSGEVRFNENDSYFLTALNYTLNNPLKAGICGPEQYPWCSYKHYEADTFLDLNLIRSLLPSVEEYEEFILSSNSERVSLPGSGKRDDSWAKSVIKEKLGVDSCTAVNGFDRAKRDEAIKLLLNEGLSERQIERLTGISRFIIRNILW